MSTKYKHIIDLATTTPNFVIGITVTYSDNSRCYSLSIHSVEINGNFRTVLVDFAVQSYLRVDGPVTRFSAKTLNKHAENWKDTPGLKELIEQILKVRKLQLTPEAAKMVGLEISNPTPEQVLVEIKKEN